jgi:5-methylcytosine-specific restriction endonuclease McrA
LIRRDPFARFAPISDDGVVAPLTTTLSSKVLVLNQNYEPLGVCSAQKAIVLLWLGKAEMVAARGDKAVHTVRFAYPYPSVVRLSLYIHLPYKKVELSRKNILRRDNFRCAYCLKTTPPLTIDHIQPRSRQGGDTWDNLVCACVRCNNRKGNRTPEEANMKLKVKPFRPNHVTFIQNVVGTVEREWEPYLFMH